MSHTTGVPFIYHEGHGKERFIVLVPFKGRKIFVGRFTSKVNAFIALNEVLGDLFPSSPLRRLSLALRRKRRVKMTDRLSILKEEPSYQKEGFYEKKERKDVRDIL